MFGSELIEVVIAIVGLYILLSIVCSAFREIFEVFQRSKPYYLHRMIFDLLEGDKNKELVCQFYKHPEIYCLFKGEVDFDRITRHTNNLFRFGGDLPSYIPSANFANAILDMAVRGVENNDQSTTANTPALSLLNARNNIAHISSARLRRAILLAIDLAGGDYGKAVANLERWFNSATQRVTGQYKRSTAIIIFLFALAISSALNIDSISLIDYIYRHNSGTPQSVGSTSNNGDAGVAVAASGATAGIPRVPLGWSKEAMIDVVPDKHWLSSLLLTLSKLGGILLTALAASLGSPFWFDLLNKLVQLRNSIPPRERDESSETIDTEQQPIIINSIPSGNPPGDTAPPAEDEDEEGFDGAVAIETKDEELPPATGGVK